VKSGCTTNSEPSSALAFAIRPLKAFRETGRERYIQLPKPGVNPRGVEITKEALVADEDSKAIDMYCQRTKIEYNPYKKWVSYWRER